MEKKIKILFLAANPKDTAPLDLDEEIREIQGRIRGSDHGTSFEFRPELALRPQELPAAVMRHNPDIVHFSGHGGKSGEIYLVNDTTKDSQAVSGETLGEIFKLLARNIRCVVLNACYSAVQAQAIARSIPCVVGMSRAVLDGSAIAFAAGFYEALAFGKDLQTAFDLGRTQMVLAQKEGQQELPKIMKREDVDLSKVLLMEPTAPNQPSNPWTAVASPSAGSVRKQQKIGNITISGDGNKTSVTQNDTFGPAAPTWIHRVDKLQEIGDVSITGKNHETTFSQNGSFGAMGADGSSIDMLKRQALALLDRVQGEIAACEMSAIKRKNAGNTARGLKEELAKERQEIVTLNEYVDEIHHQLGGVQTLAPLLENLADLISQLQVRC